MTEDPARRERVSAAALLLTHGLMLLLFDGLVAFADLRTSGVAMSLASTGNGWRAWTWPAVLLLVQGGAAALVLGCAGLEAAAGWRTLRGPPVPLRGAALAGLLGSLLLAPTALAGCSVCGFAFWPLPLGFSLATVWLAYRVPDPRLA